MKNSLDLESTLVVFITLILILFVVFKISRALVFVFKAKKFGNNNWIYFDPFPKKLSTIQENILKTRFIYYQKLPDNLKPFFRNRLAKFIRSKNFETRANLQLTEEIKTLIAASAIQLTFGLSTFHLKHFTNIIIYPSTYLSPVSGQYHKGETHVRGAVVFSWSDFKQGYEILNDNINLGLHEFAHALFIDYRYEKNPDPNFVSHFEQWKEIGNQEFFKFSPEKNFFRSYAKTNLMEFFAVSVEHFFESPNSFKKTYPELFDILCKLLNQDPSQ